MQFLGENVRHDARLTNAERFGRGGRPRTAAIVLGLTGGPDADAGEETLTGMADNLRLRQGVFGRNERQQAAPRPLAEQLVQQILDGAAADPQAEMVRRHVFQRVRFVEDDDFIVRQQVRPLTAQGQIAEK